ncbi:MAG: cytochrome c biogenesis protein ResB [Cyanobacteriota bacterium]|nr:cytochrome c biogenesis protein ResB [Cyanobacteriota bacterium]
MTWRPLLRLAAWISDLRLAIVLLLLIAVGSGVGTAIPQQESSAFYHERYDASPWLGLLDGNSVLRLQLDHVYASGWFLGLLAALGLALILCSWRRQWPALQAGLRWRDYRSGRQLSKLSVAETVATPRSGEALERLASQLEQRGWQVRRQDGRLAARRGLVGRVGPLLVHAGMVVLMVGAAWGGLAGHRLERFLAPGRSLDLMDSRGRHQLTLTLENFEIDRDPAGRPEQFSSQLRLEGDQSVRAATIRVNHPLRYRGMTLYQADWSLATISLQLGRSPVLELPLQSFPQLGEQVWGLVLPTRPDGSQPVLLTLGSEQGPVEVFASDGERLASLVPGGEAREVAGLPIRVVGVMPASGILFKRDPGVPLVYAGFAIALLGGGLSLVATRQLWAVAEPQADSLHVGGLCNRNLVAFAAELPALLETCEAQQG